MAAQDKVTFKQDLTEPVKIRHYEGVVFTGDDCGNLIKVALFDGGVPYSGGGTVSATAVLADGTTFPLTQGSITGNMVSVPLEAGALVVSGLMGLYVKISGGGIICTVLNAIFTVQATDTGRVPTATVTTVTELVAAIRDAQDSFPADLTNLLAAVAPTFSTSTAYSAGAYVWQGGKLYRFTAAHPAGTWTGTDAVAVALGNDVADLKSASKAYTHETENLLDIYATPNNLDYVTKTLGENEITVTSTAARTYTNVGLAKIDVSGIDSIFVDPYTAEGTGQATVRVRGYKSDGTSKWLGVVDHSTGTAFDVSNCIGVVVSLYAHYNDQNPSAGEYIKYSNLMVTEGNTAQEYTPHLTAVDVVARSLIDEHHPELPTTFDVVNKSLADLTLWEAGTISGTTGKNISGSGCVRTKNFIAVSADKPVYLQAYYVLPTGTNAIDVDGNDNYNMRNAYIAQYDWKGDFLVRSQLTSQETLKGKSVALNPECKYLRVAFYTRVSGTDVSAIMPGTIWFDIVTDDYWLPPYYDAYLTEKAALIEHYMRGEVYENDAWVKAYQQSDIIPFIFVTDEHAPQQNQMRSPLIMRRLAQSVHLPVVFSGGDVDHAGTLTYEYANLLRNCFDGTIYHAVGNHDFLHGNTGASLYYDLDVYNMNQIGSQDHHYYYVDNAEQKIRYIVLAAYAESPKTMGTGTDEASSGGYTTEQLAWLRASISSLPDGWGIIAFTHYFYMVRAEGDPVTLSDGYDFIRALSDNASTIAIFQGHTHLDRIIKGFSTASGVRADLPIIVTACDKNVPQSGTFPTNRASGTVYEQLFDVVIINRATKTINLIRIGGKAMDGVNTDTGSESEERTVVYGT